MNVVGDGEAKMRTQAADYTRDQYEGGEKTSHVCRESYKATAEPETTLQLMMAGR